jgi:hypothetical protein
MRTGLLVVVLVLVAAACSGSDAHSSTTTASPAPNRIEGTTTTTAAPSPTTTTAPPDTYREEWVISTERGRIVVIGEHTSDAARWVEAYGTEPGELFHEVVVIGDEAWERFAGDNWKPTDLAAAQQDLLNDHPFEVSDILAEFALVGPGRHERRPVTRYRAQGVVAAAFTGIDPATVTQATVDAAITAYGMFARYALSYVVEGGDRIGLTYRIYDVGAPITIARPELSEPVATCRGAFNQLIDEVGSYRSRYDLLHPGAVYSSIEELRLAEPWAWQTTVRFAADATAFVDTLWIGGLKYWRMPGEEWQADLDGHYQAVAYRPFVDDLWLPDVVEQFTPVAQAEVAGRTVDVYELGLEDMRLLNDGLVRDTDTLGATLWIEPCSHPELIKLEVVATGRGYVEGEFHVVYELYDLGTTDTIDIPPEALGD